MSGQTSGGTSGETLTGTGRAKASTIGMGAAIAIGVVLLIVGIGGGYFLYPGVNPKSSASGSGTTQLTETGSSLLYPLMQIWGPNYTAYNPNVLVSPASTGSGTGQTSAENGLVNMGGTDGYLSNASATHLINVPSAISAQLIYYNLPGVSGHLNLNGSILAQIYGGAITQWNSPLILAAQSSSVQTELNALSSTQIWLVKRADSSGDTFLFSSLCYMSWSGWTYSYGTSALSGLTGTYVLGETGNKGMVAGVKGQPGAIAYIGISYESQLTGATNVNYAALGDNLSLSAAGGINPANYVLPTPANISADANLGLTHLQVSTYGLAVSLILGGSPLGAINLGATAGNGGTNPVAGTTPYPIVNLEYLLIKTSPSGNTVTGAALHATVQFLEWAISYGNWNSTGTGPSAYLAAVNFVPLTPGVIGLDLEALAGVQA